MVYNRTNTIEDGSSSVSPETWAPGVAGALMNGFAGGEGEFEVSAVEQLQQPPLEETVAFATELLHQLENDLEHPRKFEFPAAADNRSELDSNLDIVVEALKSAKSAEMGLLKILDLVVSYAEQLRSCPDTTPNKALLVELADSLESKFSKVQNRLYIHTLALAGLHWELMQVYELIQKSQKGGDTVVIPEAQQQQWLKLLSLPRYTSKKTSTEREYAKLPLKYHPLMLRLRQLFASAGPIAKGVTASAGIGTLSFAGHNALQNTDISQMAETPTKAICADPVFSSMAAEALHNVEQVFNIDLPSIESLTQFCREITGSTGPTEGTTLYGGITARGSEGPAWADQLVTLKTTEMGTPSPERSGSHRLQQIPEVALNPDQDQATVDYIDAITPTELKDKSSYLLWFDRISLNEDRTGLVELPGFPSGTLLDERVQKISAAMMAQFTDFGWTRDQVEHQKVGMIVDKADGSSRISLVWQTDIAVVFDGGVQLPAGSVMLFDETGTWRYLSPSEQGDIVAVWTLGEIRPHLTTEQRQATGLATDGKVLVVVGADGRPRVALMADSVELVNQDPVVAELVNTGSSNVNLRITPEATPGVPAVDQIKPGDAVRPIPMSELASIQSSHPELFTDDLQITTNAKNQIIANVNWVLVAKEKENGTPLEKVVVAWLNSAVVSSQPTAVAESALPESAATPGAPEQAADVQSPETTDAVGINVEPISKDILLDSAAQAYLSLEVPMKTTETLNPNSLVYFVDAGISFTSSNQANLTPDFTKEPEKVNAYMKELRAQSIYYLMLRNHIQNGTDGSEIPEFSKILSGELVPGPFDLTITNFKGEQTTIQFNPLRDQIVFDTLQGMSIGGEVNSDAFLMNSVGGSSFASVETTPDGRHIIHIFQYSFDNQTFFTANIGANIYYLFFIPSEARAEYESGNWGGDAFDFMSGEDGSGQSLSDHVYPPGSDQLLRLIPLR